MKVVSTTQLRRSTMAILEAAQYEPVTITSHGNPRFVLMSHEHFESIQRGPNSANLDKETEHPR